MGSPAADTVLHFWLVNLRVLPKASLHVGKWRIREPREACSKASPWRRRSEMRFSLCTEKTNTSRETERGNSSLHYQHDSDSEEQVCRDVLTDMPHPLFP